MKESYGEGLATHTGLKSCGDVSEGGAEASTEVRAGQEFGRERTLLRGADAVGISGRPHLERRHRKTFRGPGRRRRDMAALRTGPGDQPPRSIGAAEARGVSGETGSASVHPEGRRASATARRARAERQDCPAGHGRRVERYLRNRFPRVLI